MKSKPISVYVGLCLDGEITSSWYWSKDCDRSEVKRALRELCDKRLVDEALKKIAS